MQAPGDSTYLQMPICIIKDEISARGQISNAMGNLEYGFDSDNIKDIDSAT